MAFSSPPVLLLIYNRPDLTRIVLDAIRKARPRKLFVAADGPSADREQDITKCAETRALIDIVDWDCEVKTLFRDKNLGCQKAISSAISWFYEQVEEGIILEDDCLPSQSFFRFCSELLEKYRDHDDVMVISGDNFQGGRQVTESSYYFSRYPHCWGWATWRRAWQKYDTGMRGWQGYQESDAFLEIGADEPAFKAYWSRIFERVLSGEIDSWAYAWTFNCWYHNGLTVIPSKNLVKNLGFGVGATHTTEADARINAMLAEDMDFPLQHPARVVRHEDADKYADINHFGIPLQIEYCLVDRIKAKGMSFLSKILGTRSN